MCVKNKNQPLPLDTSTPCDLAQVFREYGTSYREHHRLSTQKLKVMRAIELCRTSQLGGHVTQCNACGDIQQHYNSCRNRHCPQCQSIAKAKWLEDRQTELLPVPYFHVVFTLPHELNTLANSNPKIIYDLLFQSAQETINTLGHDPKRLNGKMGMLSILHTWGQNLSQHIHIHCLIPGGALSDDHQHWKKSKSNFLFPVKVMSKLFRHTYVRLLKQAYNDHQLIFKGQSSSLKYQQAFDELLNQLRKKAWVVYAKKPFAGPQQVLNYIGRYTHKIALSNDRIIACKKGRIKFKWRDYHDKNKEKVMVLPVEDFMRRFLQHVLPPGYVRIRYFGFMANSCRQKKIKIIRTLLNTEIMEKSTEIDITNMMLKITGVDINQCHQCHQGILKTILVVPRPSDTRQPVYWDTS